MIRYLLPSLLIATSCQSHQFVSMCEFNFEVVDVQSNETVTLRGHPQRYQIDLQQIAADASACEVAVFASDGQVLRVAWSRHGEEVRAESDIGALPIAKVHTITDNHVSLLVHHDYVQPR